MVLTAMALAATVLTAMALTAMALTAMVPIATALAAMVLTAMALAATVLTAMALAAMAPAATGLAPTLLTVQYQIIIFLLEIMAQSIILHLLIAKDPIVKAVTLVILTTIPVPQVMAKIMATTCLTMNQITFQHL